MAAATAYCTSNTAFHQHSLTTTRSQFTPVSRRTTLSPSKSFSSTASISHIEQLSIIKTNKSDENNNDHEIESIAVSNIDEALNITSDDDIDTGVQIVDHIDEEQMLAFVGLRLKIKKRIVPILTLRPLTKRLACPVCLLPLPKYSERVRQALYVRLPFLKFLSITCDIESFCSTDENARAQSLLPRSVTQTRALSTLNKSPKKQKLPKTEFISMVANTLRSNTSKTSMSKNVHSILRCQVILDRLEQSTIDQIMRTSTEDNDENIGAISTSDRSSYKTSPNTRRSISISKNEITKTQTLLTTITTEKTILKRKSTTTTTDIVNPKRFKSVDNDTTIMNNNNIKNDLSSLLHERIYLKCFVCSKRQYIDAQIITNSDVLHSHWLEHNKKLSLNIYDSEIDSILTRVVEFFNSPKQHALEGKIKTVFILNSKEIRRTSTINSSSNDPCIVID